MNPQDRLKILIDSSTPIVVMETVEEVRAVRAVRLACSALQLPTWEWSVASGLLRSGSSTEAGIEHSLPAGGYMPGAEDIAHAASAIYDSRDPAKMLGNLEAMNVEAVFILKDFHRHLDDPVVVRRLRDVGQKFSTNRRTVILTSPSISIPAELASLVEYLDLPLPDEPRLRQLIDETMARVSKTHTLQKRLDNAGFETMVHNLRGLTEEEAERAISQAVVARYCLCPETVTDVLEAKKQLLKRSQMLEFIDVSENMAQVGGLENLKNWLALRQGAW
jgi:hypothetical protein